MFRFSVVVSVLAAAFLGPTLHGQCREDDFRKLTSIELGKMKLSEIAYQSVSVDSGEAEDGMANYTVYMAVRSGSLSLFLDSSRHTPVLAGTVAGIFRWKFTVSGTSCLSIARIQAAPSSIALVVTRTSAIAMPEMGGDAKWNTNTVTLTNEDVIDISKDNSKGMISLSGVGATIKKTSIALVSGAAPANVDFCSVAGARSKLTFDLRSSRVGGLTGTFHSCAAKNSVPTRILLTRGNTVIAASGFQSGSMLLSASPQSLSLKADKPLLINPEIHLNSTNMPVAAVKSVLFADFTVPLTSTGGVLSVQAATSSQPFIEPDQLLSQTSGKSSNALTTAFEFPIPCYLRATRTSASSLPTPFEKRTLLWRTLSETLTIITWFC